MENANGGCDMNEYLRGLEAARGAVLSQRCVRGTRWDMAIVVCNEVINQLIREVAPAAKPDGLTMRQFNALVDLIQGSIETHLMAGHESRPGKIIERHYKAVTEEARAVLTGEAAVKPDNDRFAKMSPDAAAELPLNYSAELDGRTLDQMIAAPSEKPTGAEVEFDEDPLCADDAARVDAVLEYHKKPVGTAEGFIAGYLRARGVT